MKHGYVTNGRTTTLYGRVANTFVAKKMAENCDTHDQAIAAIKRSTGAMRESLIANLHGKFLLTEEDNEDSRKQFLVTPKLEKELEELDLQRAVAAKEEQYKANKLFLKSQTSQEAKSTLKIKCLVCKKAITKGQQYRKYKRLRAHKGCV